jgi:hypothetical protein
VSSRRRSRAGSRTAPTSSSPEPKPRTATRQARERPAWSPSMWSPRRPAAIRSAGTDAPTAHEASSLRARRR